MLFLNLDLATFRGLLMTESCLCRNCIVDVGKINEYAYVVTSEIWSKVAPDDTDSMGYYLCVTCLERRLGRELLAGDFTAFPLNWLPCFVRSKKLSERLSRQGKPSDEEILEVLRS